MCYKEVVLHFWNHWHKSDPLSNREFDIMKLTLFTQQRLPVDYCSLRISVPRKKRRNLACCEPLQTGMILLTNWPAIIQSILYIHLVWNESSVSALKIVQLNERLEWPMKALIRLSVLRFISTKRPTFSLHLSCAMGVYLFTLMHQAKTRSSLYIWAE